MSNPPPIDLRSIEDVFFDAFQSAQQKLKIQLTDDTGAYMMRLVSQNIAVNQTHILGMGDMVLADLFSKARDTAKLEDFTQLGNTSLMMIGFFAGYFNKRSVGVDYCANMGSAAFNICANKDPKSIEFRELADNFVNCADVLLTTGVEMGREISDNTTWQNLLLRNVGVNSARQNLQNTMDSVIVLPSTSFIRN